MTIAAWGKSEQPAGPYTIPRMAADGAAVLDAAGVDRAHVFGVSMGGIIAQEIALQYPQRVEALEASAPILYDTGTPRHLIDEDFVIRRRTYPTPEAYMARLPQISAPTLVIHGESDRLAPAANGKLIADRIPGRSWCWCRTPAICSRPTSQRRRMLHNR